LTLKAFTSFYITTTTIRFVEGLFVNINIIKKLTGAFGLSLCPLEAHEMPCGGHTMTSMAAFDLFRLPLHLGMTCFPNGTSIWRLRPIFFLSHP